MHQVLNSVTFRCRCRRYVAPVLLWFNVLGLWFRGQVGRATRAVGVGRVCVTRGLFSPDVGSCGCGQSPVVPWAVPWTGQCVKCAVSYTVDILQPLSPAPGRPGLPPTAAPTRWLSRRPSGSVCKSFTPSAAQLGLLLGLLSYKYKLV